MLDYNIVPVWLSSATAPPSGPLVVVASALMLQALTSQLGRVVLGEVARPYPSPEGTLYGDFR